MASKIDGIPSSSESEKGSKQKTFQLLDSVTLRLFAESRGVHKSRLTNDAWKILGEEVNFRLRELANTGLVHMKQCKRHELKTADINAAAQLLNYLPLLGHRNPEQPKLHVLKDLGLYVSNEGVVELAPLALSPLIRPPLQPYSFQGCILSSDSVSSGQEKEETNGGEKLDAVLKLLDTGLQENTKNLRWTNQFRTAALDLAALERIFYVIQSKLPDNPCVIICSARVVGALVANEQLDLERVLGDWLETLLKALFALSFDHWSDLVCWEVGHLLRAVDKRYGRCKRCSGVSLAEEFLVGPLRDPKQPPLNYSTSLICLRALGFPTLLNVDVEDLLRLHSQWNGSVFQTTTPFEKGQPEATFTRIVYVAAWRGLVERILGTAMRAMSESKTLAPVTLYQLALDIFGPLRLNPLPMGTPTMVEPRLGRVFNSLVAQPIQIGAKSGKSSGKRRKRRVTDIFEIPKKFKLRHQRKDFIFVFHATEGRVLLDSVSQQKETKESVRLSRSWSKWLDGKKSGSLKLLGPTSSPACLDLASAFI